MARVRAGVERQPSMAHHLPGDMCVAEGKHRFIDLGEGSDVCLTYVSVVIFLGVFVFCFFN